MNSMTGFGAATAPFKNSAIRVEIGGVNRKQAEVAVAMPRAWAELETSVRETVSAAVSRGRVNVGISLTTAAGTPAVLTVNKARLSSFKRCLNELMDSLDVEVEPTLDAMVRLGIIGEETEADITPQEVQPALNDALQQALKAFQALRAQEGENMKRDLLARIQTLRGYRAQLAERAAGVPQRYRENLMKRLEECGLPLPLDDERIVKEIALFADRCDVTEEMTRLSSHLDQFEKICEKDEPVGRTLDFLCQEIFRELNTTGSKANDAALAQLVVNAKTELEKVREQVQNIE